MNIDDNSNVISFAGGIPSTSLFPKDEFQNIQIDLLKNNIENIFLYSPV